MARSVLILNNPTFKLASSQAGLAAGKAYECQLTSAAVTPVSNFQTIPATGCAPASQAPGRSSWQLDLNWLEDWTASLGGLSGFAYTNDTVMTWFQLLVDSVGSPTVTCTGQAYVVAGAYGGTFGDGSPAQTSATWPCLDKPVIVLPATLVADEESADVA